MSNCHSISGITFLMGSWDKSKHSHPALITGSGVAIIITPIQTSVWCVSVLTNVGRVHMLRFAELSTILQQGKIKFSLSISCHFIQNTLWFHPSMFLSEVLQVTNKLICINRDNILTWQHPHSRWDHSPTQVDDCHNDNDASYTYRKWLSLFTCAVCSWPAWLPVTIFIVHWVSWLQAMLSRSAVRRNNAAWTFLERNHGPALPSRWCCPDPWLEYV